MAGREGGGGVVGQSHRNSEEKQRLIPGTTDTDGSGQTVNFFYLSPIFIFVSHFVQFCITIRLCFCIILCVNNSLLFIGPKNFCKVCGFADCHLMQ